MTATLAGIPTTVLNRNDTFVDLSAGNSSTSVTGPVVLVADIGTIVSSQSNNWTQLPNGVVSQVSPIQGVAGTIITITGTGLLGGATSLSFVTISGVSVSSIVSAVNSQVVVIAGSGTSGTSGQVVLVANTGATVFNPLITWTYVTSGVVTNLNPSVGQGGTLVTLTGTNLLCGGNSVVSAKLGGLAAQGIKFWNNTMVVIVASPSNVATTVNATFVTDTGVVVSTANTFTYATPGQITDINPSSGQLGTRVVISGVGLDEGGASITGVSIGGVAATIVAQNSTSVTAIVGGSNYGGFVNVILISDTGSVLNTSSMFTYLTNSHIYTVQPAHGQIGTIVTLTGTGFYGGGTEVVNVSLAGVPVTSIVSSSDNSVVIIAAGSAPMTGDVVITSDTGAEVIDGGAWTYDTASHISSINPTSGQAGTVVTVSGSLLLGYNSGSGTVISSATLGGVPAVVRTPQSGSQIILVAGLSNVSTSAVGDVVLQTSWGSQSIGSGLWTYVPSSISSVTPTSGQAGTLVTISGIELIGAGATASVTLAGQIATTTFANQTTVIVSAGSGSPGSGDVVLESVYGQTATKTGGWTYVTSPSISSVVPSHGQGGAWVTISGINLLGGGTSVSNVIIGGVNVPSVLFQNNTYIIAVVPSANVIGQAEDVAVVSNTGSRVSLSSAWTFDATSVLSHISPTSGRYGTVVKLTGSAFTSGGIGVQNVTFGGIVASVINVTSTTIFVSCGDSAISQSNVDVIVTFTSEATVTLSGAWTFIVSTISIVLPSSGQGGTSVNIVGTNMLGGGSSITTVLLAGYPAQIKAGGSGDENTAVVVIAEDFGTIYTGDVTVIADSGATVIKSNAWTYLAAGNITGVAPSVGQSGVKVTISGSNLLGGGTKLVAASLAGIPAVILNGSLNSYVVIQSAAGPSTRSAATGDIVLTSDSGVVARLINGWTYSVVDSISPADGQTGTIVTISGIGLLGGGSQVTAVTLAGISATAVLEANDTEVVIVAGARSSGVTGLCTITSNVGQVSSQTGFTNQFVVDFTYEVPGSISSVSPSQGQAGTLVTISGTQLFGYGNGVETVTLAGVNANVISATSSVIVVSANSSSATSVSNVTIYCTSGPVITKVSSWAYVNPGTIASVTPDVGQIGTVVTILGSGLLSGGSSITNVTLAGVAAQIVYGNATEVVVLAGANAFAGQGSVVVVSNNGASVVLLDAWNYTVSASVSSITPSVGQYGTIVTITGVGLSGLGSVATVLLNSYSANITFANDTFVVVRAGHGSGTGVVSVISTTGATAT